MSKSYDYKITLGNDTEIMANLNGNTWETNERITEDTFTGGLESVSYEFDGDTVELGEVALVFMGNHDNEVWFALNPLTDAEIAAQRIDAQVYFTAVSTDTLLEE